MSLRARLTIFYSAVLGGVLILFGLAVYGLISVVLMRQMDSTLQRSVDDLIYVMRVDENDNFTFTQRISIDSSVIIQIWDDSEMLVAMSPTVDNQSPFREPLDKDGMAVIEPSYRNVVIAERSYRVLNVPLTSDGTLLKTTLPLTIVITGQPFNIFPLKGLHLHFVNNFLLSTFFSRFISIITKSAS